MHHTERLPVLALVAAASLVGGCPGKGETTEDASLACEVTEDCPQGHKCVYKTCVPRVDSGSSKDQSIQPDRGSPPDARPPDRWGRFDVPASVSCDLTLKNLTVAPATAATGTHPTKVSYLICNFGPRPLAAPNTRVGVKFVLSKNDIYGDSDDSLVGGNGYDISRKTGDCEDINLSETGLSYLTIPSVTPGQYYFFARVDHESPSKLVDPNPGNNDAHTASPITVK